MSEDIGENLDEAQDEAAIEVEKRAASAKIFDFDLGIETSGIRISGVSFSWIPHTFLYVPAKATGEGMRYAIDKQALIVEEANRNRVQAGTLFGKALWKIAEFSLPQYVAWSASAWIVAALTERDEYQLPLEQILRFVDINVPFSFAFWPGAVNCWTFVLVAGLEGLAISRRNSF